MKRLTHHLYFWVLVAIIAGGLFGHFDPERAVKLKPLGDGFIALVKMLISPVIFCTVVLGIAGAGDMKKVGRVGAKALLYFEIVSTFALIIGLLVVNIVRPGAGFNADPATLDANAVADYSKRAASQNAGDFILNIIPATFFDAFTGGGDLLQVLYLTMAALFVAQALNIDLSLRQQLTILGVAMLTSKGASGVVGAGFITLAATLAVVPSIPVAGLALILGIDRFMAEARSITNFIGNGVATVVISHWERELDRKKLLDTLKGHSV